MKKLNLVVVDGNLQKENDSFRNMESKLMLKV